MRFTSFVIALANTVSTAIANCSDPSAPPDNGDIALYSNKDCTGSYLNVGALNSCQNWPDFDACSAITRAGVTCDIYESDGCDDDYLYTIDSSGYRNFCGVFRDNIQSVRCRNA